MSLDLIIPRNLVRNWKRTHTGDDPLQIQATREEAVVLDLFIRNRGAAPIILTLDGQDPITIDPGDPFTANDILMGIIDVVASDTFDLAVAGMSFRALRSMGVM